MSVLIVYATLEGHTAKIARFIGDEIQRAGQQVTLAEISDSAHLPTFEGVDRVVLAAPVHERRHPDAFEAFVAANRKLLEARKTLLVSVGLRVAFEDGQEEAMDYLEELKMRTDFTPDLEALVAGAVRAGGYDYFQKQVLQRVVLREGDSDLADGEREFTDWQELSATVKKFLALHS